MNTPEEKSAGFIELQFVDGRGNQIVSLGGAGFQTEDKVAAAWASVPVFSGETAFVADRLDTEGDIVDDKPISAETCEALLGKPIAALISAGRDRLKASLEDLGQ